MMISEALVLVLGVAVLVGLSVAQGYHWGWRAASSEPRIREIVAAGIEIGRTHEQLGVKRVLSAPTPAAEDERWQKIAGNFQQAVADAKGRLDAAEMPATCVFADCDEDVVASIVDVKGHAIGLCTRHQKRWGRMDEDERRAVRNGVGS